MNTAAEIRHLPAENLCQNITPTARRTDQGDVRRPDDRRAHGLKARRSPLIDEADTFDGDRTRVGWRPHCLTGLPQAFHRELADDLLVLDRHVGPLLIPVDQLLDRRGQVTIGRDHRDELADVEGAGQRQIAANGIEEERRHLREEIIQILDGKFAPEKIGANFIQYTEPATDFGFRKWSDTMDVDRGRPLNDLADAARQFAGLDLALAGKTQLFPPQARDHVGLDQHDTQGDQTQPVALDDNEQRRRCRLHAEECRLDKCVAGKPADRLNLIFDDRCGFGRLDGADVFRSKAQQQGKELEADAPQHALAEHTLRHVDDIFERAIDEHKRQKNEAQRHQQLGATEVEAIREDDGVTAEELRHRY